MRNNSSLHFYMYYPYKTEYISLYLCTDTKKDEFKLFPLPKTDGLWFAEIFENDVKYTSYYYVSNNISSNHFTISKKYMFDMLDQHVKSHQMLEALDKIYYYFAFTWSKSTSMFQKFQVFEILSCLRQSLKKFRINFTSEQDHQLQQIISNHFFDKSKNSSKNVLLLFSTFFILEDFDISLETNTMEELCQDLVCFDPETILDLENIKLNIENEEIVEGIIKGMENVLKKGNMYCSYLFEHFKLKNDPNFDDVKNWTRCVEFFVSKCPKMAVNHLLTLQMTSERLDVLIKQEILTFSQIETQIKILDQQDQLKTSTIQEISLILSLNNEKVLESIISLKLSFSLDLFGQVIDGLTHTYYCRSIIVLNRIKDWIHHHLAQIEKFENFIPYFNQLFATRYLKHSQTYLVDCLITSPAFIQSNDTQIMKAILQTKFEKLSHALAGFLKKHCILLVHEMDPKLDSHHFVMFSIISKNTNFQLVCDLLLEMYTHLHFEDMLEGDFERFLLHPCWNQYFHFKIKHGQEKHPLIGLIDKTFAKLVKINLKLDNQAFFQLVLIVKHFDRFCMFPWNLATKQDLNVLKMNIGTIQDAMQYLDLLLDRLMDPKDEFVTEFHKGIKAEYQKWSFSTIMHELQRFPFMDQQSMDFLRRCVKSDLFVNIWKKNQKTIKCQPDMSHLVDIYEKTKLEWIHLFASFDSENLSFRDLEFFTPLDIQILNQRDLQWEKGKLEKFAKFCHIVYFVKHFDDLKRFGQALGINVVKNEYDQIIQIIKRDWNTLKLSHVDKEFAKILHDLPRVGILLDEINQSKETIEFLLKAKGSDWLFVDAHDSIEYIVSNLKQFQNLKVESYKKLLEKLLELPSTLVSHLQRFKSKYPLKQVQASMELYMSSNMIQIE